VPRHRTAAPRETPTSAEHVLDVLLAFSAAEEPLGVAEVSRRVGLPTSTVHRALVTLEGSRYLERTPGGAGYRVGPAVHEQIYAVFDRFAIHSASLPYLRRLASTSGETATLYVPVARHYIRIAGIEGWREVHRPLLLGEIFPLHAGSAGRAMLACMPDAEIATYLAQASLEAPSPSTVTDPGRLWEDVCQTRERGYALGLRDVYPEATAIAFPIRERTGCPAGCLSLAGAASQFDPRPGDPKIDEWKAIALELEREVQRDAERFRNPYGHVDARSIMTAAPSVTWEARGR